MRAMMSEGKKTVLVVFSNFVSPLWSLALKVFIYGGKKVLMLMVFGLKLSLFFYMCVHVQYFGLSMDLCICAFCPVATGGKEVVSRSPL